MTKRPPEMVELLRHDEPNGVNFIGLCDDGTWVNADDAFAAIRSLRVKLFRERADNWSLRAGDEWSIHSCLGENIADEYAAPYRKKAERFSRIADAIERGEK